MPKMSECTKPHALVHLVSGAGVGLLLSGVFAGSATTLGIALVVLGVVGEFFTNK
ncbi:hypothetical protein HYZ78_02840 [Candidatus Microgenomates bacterium]|nr:hypothetical protein [Candidatus Microgenomates bacterium]